MVAFIVFAGLGLLRWSAVVYRLSDGERGWSLGASVYQMLGWGTEAYQEDFDWTHSLDDGEAEWTGPLGHRRFGRGLVRARFVRGFGRLVFLALLIGVGVFVYGRWRQDHPTAPASGK
jgi:hypothetical protein